MNVKEIIQLNNEKRESLNDENVADYEDMLLYIRTNSTKSERGTEEILLELLDHLLDAQAEGRTAKEVFGQDLKLYCQELIAEIPSETKKEQFIFATYISLRFLAIISFVYGIIGFGLYYLFQVGSNLMTFNIGSAVTIVIVDLFILLLFIYGILRWIQASVFKAPKPNKWIEFFQVWLICTLSIGLFIVVIYFMPQFGKQMSMSTITLAGIGVVLYVLSLLINRKRSTA